jgi:hypothetical protein
MWIMPSIIDAHSATRLNRQTNQPPCNRHPVIGESFRIFLTRNSSSAQFIVFQKENNGPVRGSQFSCFIDNTLEHMLIIQMAGDSLLDIQ